jgi:hypothetical protein
MSNAVSNAEMGDVLPKIRTHPVCERELQGTQGRQKE